MDFFIALVAFFDLNEATSSYARTNLHLLSPYEKFWENKIIASIGYY